MKYLEKKYPGKAGQNLKTLSNIYKDLEKYLALYDEPLEKLIETASELKKQNQGNKVEFCSIISAKTGKCSEDCTYCTQSSFYKTGCKTHDLIDKNDVIGAAKDAQLNGASRFCIVTSGKGIQDPNEFNSILDMVSSVAALDNLHSCCSLGIVSYDQAVELKKAGLERFNHNVNTAKSFYKNICTTHSYEERLQTIINLKNAGVEICCGGIIGLGESRKQRIEMALEIKELKPTSVPLNFLIPMPGTPVENLKDTLTTEEILKTIAIFRIIMPDVLIRFAGGRSTHLNFQEQLLGLKAGINALLVGNYLTALGNSPEQDKELIQEAGLTLIED